MKRLVLLSAFVATGCLSPKGYMDPRALDPAIPTVVGRYLDYVATGKAPDGTPLSEIQAETWRVSGELVLETWQLALSEVE